jgi:hypothetical protein
VFVLGVILIMVSKIMLGKTSKTIVKHAKTILCKKDLLSLSIPQVRNIYYTLKNPDNLSPKEIPKEIQKETGVV